MSIIKKSHMTFEELCNKFGWKKYSDYRKRSYRFLLYFLEDLEDKEVTKHDLITAFHHLFDPVRNNLLLLPMVAYSGNIWEDDENVFKRDSIPRWKYYCDDVGTYDAETRLPLPTSKETLLYWEMLKKDRMYNYRGLGYCMDWDKFLSITLECMLKYRTWTNCSFLFYDPINQFEFYFHHTNSIGIIYNQFNDAIMHILKQSKAINLDVWNWEGDPKTLEKIKGDINYKGERRAVYEKIEDDHL
jgi:hypothetical protein